ncbi:MAG: neuraminidase-like domain-containing protein [Desulfobacterales bacterium]|nr:neuraminidase-like domain-containing protein [Desulfobacterales bacterium]
MGSTKDRALPNVRPGEYRIDLAIDFTAAAPRVFYSVSGKVASATGDPVASYEVRAYHHDPEEETELGRTTTDEHGSYFIAYTSDLVCDSIEAKADLILRVFHPSGADRPVASSPLILNARAREYVNFAVGEGAFVGPTEFSILRGKLTSCLGRGRLGEQNGRGVMALANETGLSPAQAAQMSAAEKLAAHTGVRAEIFYGFLCQKLPLSLDGLLSQTPETLHAALTQAAAANQIDPSLADNWEAVESDLRRLRVRFALEASPNGEPSILKGYFQQTGLPEESQTELLQAYFERSPDQPLPDFWDSMARRYGTRAVSRLQLSVRLGGLTRQHLPLVKALMRNASISDLRDLASYTADDWLQLIDAEQTGVPDLIPGDTPQERQRNYAVSLTRIVEDLYPTPVLAARLQADGRFEDQDLKRFFANNPDFEFADSPVRHYIENKPSAMRDIGDPDQALDNLEAMQRLFRITPAEGRYGAVKPLMDQNLVSAAAIHRMGKTKFIDTLGPQMGTALAGKVWANAEKKSGTALAIYLKFNKAFKLPGTYVIPDEGPGQGDPNLPANFDQVIGATGHCDCKDCRSVLSPSAYLVDLLTFLERGSATSATSAQDELLKRRPDIAQLELDCENAQTLLPYIDLVNEVLENAVLVANSQPTVPVAQTEAGSEELQAMPAALNSWVYDHLIQQSYPWQLPFNLWHEECKRYLGHMGVSRPEIMSVFRKEGEFPNALDIAAAKLQLTPEELDLIASPASNDQGLAALWGTAPAAFPVEIEALPLFLERAGMDYETLQVTLGSRYVNPEGPNQVHVEFARPDCDLASATLINIDPSFLDRFHRFRRLQMKLGWSMSDLDRTITAMPTDDIDTGLLQQVAAIVSLQEKTRMPLVDILSWWGPLDTTSYEEDPSHYARLFLDHTNPDHSAFELQPDGSDLVQPFQSLLDTDNLPDNTYFAIVQGAVNLRADELQRLIQEELPNADMNLANLSHLFRVASLTRGLNISLDEYRALKSLIPHQPITEIHPDQAATPEDSWAFAGHIDSIRRAGFSVEGLDYLLYHRFPDGSRLPPNEDTVGIMLDELRAQLSKIESENTISGPDVGAGVAAHLARYLGDAAASTAMDIAQMTSPLPQNEQEAFIQTWLAAFTSPTDAIAKLVDPATMLSDVTARLKFIQDAMVRHTMADFVYQKLAEAVEIETAAAQSLLQLYLPHPSDSAQRAVQAFTNDSFVLSDPSVKATPSVFPDLFAIYERLHKIAMIAKAFRLRPEEIDFVLQHGPAIGWLDLTALPLSKNSNNPNTGYENWRRLHDVYDLAGRLAHPDFSIFNLLREAREATDMGIVPQLLEQLAAGTDWNVAELQYLTGPAGFGIDTLEAYQDERWLRKLFAAFDLIRRTGLSASQLWDFGQVPTMTSAEASLVRNAARSRYPLKRWLETAPTLRDPLREAQRDALQAYLLFHQGHADKEALFEYYLLDIEMSACALTSRIKLAISAVQTFVQRCLMGLEQEPVVTFSADDAEEWIWRKAYRVWEANRKVFLYPENWVDPELRLDASQFFREMLDELAQDEVTAETAERVYLNYLYKLDATAKLEISGLFWDPEQQTLHLFARTKGNPHNYFYRRWVKKSWWTSWEQVPLDIEGDYLMPVWYNRRLFLFWPRIEIKTRQNAQSEISEKAYELKMFWSEYRNGQWSRTQISRDPLKLIFEDPHNLYHYERKAFFFPHHIDDHGGLVIRWGYLNAGYTDKQDVNLEAEEGFGGHYHPDFRYEIHNEAYRMNDCHGVLERIETASDVFTGGEFPSPLQSSGIQFMKFFDYSGPLNIPYRWKDPKQTPGQYLNRELFGKFPNPYFIAWPLQYPFFLSQSPFTYEDGLRVFVVEPFIRKGRFYPKFIFDLSKLSHTSLEILDIFDQIYWPLAASSEDAISSGSEVAVQDSAPVATRYRNVLSPGTYYTGRNDRSVLNRNVTSNSQQMASSQLALKIDAILKKVVDGAFHSRMPNIRRYRFHTFYHPHTCLFIRQLQRYGIEGLLRPLPQGEGDDLLRQKVEADYFEEEYDPKLLPVAKPYPVDDIDFSIGGAYSPYNWELFFHIPLLIADQLSRNQRFEEAQRWYHFIFDPTETEGETPRRFWKLKPFYNIAEIQSIQELTNILNGSQEFDTLVSLWEDNPFQPHLIARFRLVSYMRAVIMKYLDNLIAWGDQLFRRDSMESINEATQIYILAAQILGKRPSLVEKDAIEPLTFNSLPSLDAISNAQIQIENQLNGGGSNGNRIQPSNHSSMLDTLPYFCVPYNRKLLGYWDTVADRLFKIRHCMNIEGVVRQLPLFQPPIDPGLLVKATAAGVDLSSALNDLNASLPYYRFRTMIEKATALCNEVRNLGGAMLSALEKRDAEALSLIRAGQEASLLKTAQQVKAQAIKEAEQALAALERAREVVDIRLQDYKNRKPISDKEQSYMRFMERGHQAEQQSADQQMFASFMYVVPNISVGPMPSSTFGGSNLGHIHEAMANTYRVNSIRSANSAQAAQVAASYERRQEDWDLQVDLAEAELKELDKRIAAAEIRVAMAQSDLQTHMQQVEQAKEIAEFTKDKYTNRQLYNWMVGQIAGLYFQTYKMAYDLAKQAESAFRYELAVSTTNFIQFGYWDSLKKGLLAGERLNQDLRRMDLAYLAQNKREFELTKHVSLAQLDPTALLSLQETGSCTFSVPEVLYDLEYPGHYMRRIKSVSVTVPCVTGPYTNVNCQLTLLKNQVRVSTDTSGGYPNFQDLGLFNEDTGGFQSIAGSSGKTDAGVFELNFRDERYLPFEGTGAVSQWRIEFPADFRQFDYDTISDVILHVHYTARDGGSIFRNNVSNYVETGLNNLMDELQQNQVGIARLFSMKKEFPNSFHQFLRPAPSADGQSTAIRVEGKHFPYFISNRDLEVVSVDVILKPADGFTPQSLSNLQFDLDNQTNRDNDNPLFTLQNFQFHQRFGNLPVATVTPGGDPRDTWYLAAKEGPIAAFPNGWVIQETVDNVTHNRINPDALEDVLILVTYLLK